MRRLWIRPSASFVIGTAALLVALAGTGYAAAKINGSQITKHSIAGNRLKANTLTGSQIKESTLGVVPRAKSATNASTVGGSSVKSFRFAIAPNGSSHTVHLAGITLVGLCATSVPSLTASGAAGPYAGLVVQGTDTDGPTPFATRDTKFDSTASDSLLGDAPTSGAGTAVVTLAGSGVTTISYSYLLTNDGNCTYAGTAVAAP